MVAPALALTIVLGQAKILEHFSGINLNNLERMICVLLQNLFIYQWDCANLYTRKNLWKKEK